MKILNLDEVAPIPRTVKVSGVDYPIVPLSMKDFLKMTRQGEEMEKRVKAGEDLVISEVVSIQLESVQSAIPTMPPEVLNSLSYQQIEAIVQFVGQTSDEAAEKAGAKSGKAKAK